MNRPIRNLAVACLVLFLALIANASYVQFFQADDLSSLTKYPRNSRVSEEAFSAPRGDILVNGRAIVSSKPSGDKYKFQRVYTNGPEYAHIVGYFGRGRIGGLEASQNEYLTGEAPELFVNRLSDLLTNQPPAGGNVVLTLNSRAQKAAYAALGQLGRNVQAAAVAIEPSTGKILAMVSNPGFNPADIATRDFTRAATAYSRLLDSERAPLNNRAIEERVPPGSTFKLVTAAAALSSGRYNPQTPVNGQARLDFSDSGPNSAMVNHNGRNCGGNQITLTRALEVSCNVSFADIGLDLGADALQEQAEKFGFNVTEPFFTDLDDQQTRQVPSLFPDLPDNAQTQLGQSAIGQFNVSATPLEMAMVTAGIANNGTVMEPYLVNEIRSSDLKRIEAASRSPEVLSQAVTASVAAQLRQMMVSVVENGTGSNARIPGVSVGGKTGTAQIGEGRTPYAWFVSFAPAQNPEVAVAVVVLDTALAARRGCGASSLGCEGGISGNEMAAPVARSIMEAVLNR